MNIGTSADTDTLQPRQRSAGQHLIFLLDGPLLVGERVEPVLIREEFAVMRFQQLRELMVQLQNGVVPDAMVLDQATAADWSELKVLLARHLPRGEACPIIVTGSRPDIDTRLLAHRAGASHYLTVPFELGQLVSVLNSLLNRPLQEPFKLLLVDADSERSKALTVVLAADERLVTRADSLAQVAAVVRQQIPDLFILQGDIEGASPLELAVLLRELTFPMILPFVFLAGDAAERLHLLRSDPGEHDVLLRTEDPQLLLSTVEARALHVRRQAGIRQRLQRNLQEREWEHLALNQHAIVSIADRKGDILYANDKFCEISGFTRAELLGRNHRLLKSGQHADRFYQGLWYTISQGKVWQGEICNRTKSGDLYWVESTITPLLDKRGMPYQYVSIRTNITPLKQQQNALEDLIEFTDPGTGQEFFARVAEGVARVSGMTLVFISASEDRFSNRFHTLACWQSGALAEDFVYVPDQVLAARFGSGEPIVLGAGASRHFAVQQATLGQALWGAVAIPLLDAEDQVIGHLVVMDNNTAIAAVIQKIPVLRIIAGRVAGEMERRRGEQAIEQHKERLRRGQLHANIGTWDWNIVTGELLWTERIAPLFGYPAGNLETSYENFLAAVHPDDRQRVSDAVNACVQWDTPYEIEHRVVWPDGSVRWLLEKGAVQRDANGNPTQMLGVVQDIDQRKRTELELAEHQQQLQAAQALAHLGDWHIQFESGDVYWSDEMFRILGHDASQYRPTLASFWDAVLPEDWPRLKAAIATAVSSGELDLVHRIIRPDGSMRHVRQLARAEVVRNGKLIKLAGTLQDISDRVAAEQELIRAREEAERANNAKSEFLSSMSHELRTPMNAILGFGQLLEIDATLQPDQQDSVQEILKAGKHLLELINEVLDLAKIEAGKVDLALEPLALSGMLDECFRLVGSLATHRRVELNRQVEPNVFVLADRTRLKQVLLNFLSNAVKYNRVGGSVSVDLNLMADSYCRLSIRDTGRGIAPDHLDKLFQPFNRLGVENGEIEGTGIGLTITQRIIDLMGGRIGVDSELGVGSCFWIDLPVTQALMQVSPVLATQSAAPVQPSSVRRRVLYIEDNPANLKLVEQVLASCQHIQMLAATTPEQGIQLARSEQPDLVLLDINLPNIDGYQVMTELRKYPELRDMPVIAVTANAMPLDIERGMNAGFLRYVTKPLDVTRFIAVVNESLQR